MVNSKKEKKEENFKTHYDINITLTTKTEKKTLQKESTGEFHL